MVNQYGWRNICSSPLAGGRAFLLPDSPDTRSRANGEASRVDQHLEQLACRLFSWTLIALLGIVREIDTVAALGNPDASVRCWTLLGGYARDARDVYERRYQSLLADHTAA